MSRPIAYLVVFVSSCCTLILELVAGRILAPFIGVSLYTWTSIIGVVLAGISLGNYLGGRIADRWPQRRTLGILLVAGGLASLAILPLITPESIRPISCCRWAGLTEASSISLRSALRRRLKSLKIQFAAAWRSLSHVTATSRVAFTASMGAMSEAPIVNGALLSAGAFHFAVVVDQTNSLISLYTNGALSASGALSSSLSAINASNCWLGRSQYAGDPYFAGTFDEFRVYSAALSAADVAFSQSAGPNPVFL